MEWIEEHPNGWTYELICPKCRFRYRPESNEDGTLSEIYHFCPKCGEKLNRTVIK